MTNSINTTANLTIASAHVDEAYWADYEDRMREQDRETHTMGRAEDPVDLYGGDDTYNEYTMGDQGDW